MEEFERQMLKLIFIITLLFLPLIALLECLFKNYWRVLKETWDTWKQYWRSL
jgi:hypothetical protein